MSSPVYPGNAARVSFTGRDFDPDNPLTDVDAIGVAVTILDPEGSAVVAAAVMAWDGDAWRYLWTAGPAGTYRLEAVLTALDGSTSTAWGDFTVDAPPDADPPATKHFLAPWCDVGDLPTGRLKDSSGNPITDIPLGWMIAAATDLLYVLSGRQFRSGRSVIRPTTIVRRSFPQVYPYSSMAGYGGGWGLGGWGFEPGWAWSSLGEGWLSSSDAQELLLQGPVTKINRVLLDGRELVEGTDFTVFDRRRLVLSSSAGTWPWQQDPMAPTTQAGTAEVDYEWGNPTPASGSLAAAELSIDLALGFSGQDACRLPARVLQVATQGVTTAVGDALEFLKEDLTGLPICDLFLRARNPGKRRRRSVFIGPESVLGRSR